MEFVPRDYQTEAVDGIYDFFLKRIGNPIVVLPTAAGKSWIQAMFIKRALDEYPRTRLLVVSHVKELLEQNAEKIHVLNPVADVDFCSASMKRRRFDSQILVCGIQTAYKHAEKIGYADLVLVDECHLIPDNANTMYRTFFEGLTKMNPRLKIIGLTATPYRLSSGLMYGKEDSFFSDVAYELPVMHLIERGHLSRLTGRRGVTHVDLSAVKTRGGEFIDSDVQAAFDRCEITESIVAEVIEAAKGMEGILIFSSGVKHAHHMAEAISLVTKERVEVVSGTTNKTERESIINDFKERKYRWLINYGVLTTGFDAPHVDLIALCRATKSTGLYVQICGRGMRLSPGKEKCVVLDYGGNIARHGPIDQVRPSEKRGDGDGEAPIKECPECLALLHLSVMICPECEYEFPPPPIPLDQTAANDAIMSDEYEHERMPVIGVEYTRHKKDGKPDSLRVYYWITEMLSVSEWVCFEHSGFARRKAEQWSERRGIVPPDDVEQAISTPWPGVSEVIVDMRGRWPELVDVVFGETVQDRPPDFPDNPLDDDIDSNQRLVYDTEEIPF